MDNIDDYGTCCVCESEMDECILIQLDYKIESESGWGCLVCDLPMDGAMAVVCFDCFDDDDLEDKIKFLMNGRRGRIPVPPPESRIKHEHNLMLHPETQDVETLWE
ncbi:MAG: hypothetical protein F4118_00340 [Acidimicrobiaceae bacterium]|nr:hypothetical protein [Candidatus Poribacteria bacterium]MYI34870.1 hypothetical protein [Acidimicrobiaceae bacterium]